MLNYSMWSTEPKTEKEIVRISYAIRSTKRFKAMTDEQKHSLVNMIERFEASLAATKKQISDSIKTPQP